jgi:hypothetical protein
MWLAKCPVLLLAGISVASAGTIQFSGLLDPATNPNLTYFDQFSGIYTSPLAGPDDYDRAFNIAVHTFPVGTPGWVNIESTGYGFGGFDAVVSVFQGTGASAIYLHHQFNQLFPGDFSFNLNLGVGVYTLAISMFLNEPCAAGGCTPPLTGTFGDGFTNLVNFDPFAPQPLFYNVRVTDLDVPPTVIPEPSAVLLLASGLCLPLVRRLIKCL